MAQNFNKTVRVLRMALDSKSTIPFLAHIHQSAGHIWATDLDMVASFPCEDSGEASYDKQGNRLAHAIELEIRSPLSIATPTVNGTPGRKVDMPADFIESLRKVRPAISTEETRYYLNGLYFDFGANSGRDLALVATDGHRLHRMIYPGFVSWEVPKPGKYRCHNSEMCAIVPRQAIDILLAHKGGDWQATFGDASAEFIDRSTGFRLVTKIIDGTYPDYHRVIPREDRRAPAIHGNAKTMLQVVKGFNSYGTERSKSMKIEGPMLSMQQGDLAAMEAVWPVGSPTEYPYEFGFNQRYLRDVLEACGGAGVTMQMHDPASPARFICADERFTAVLMPLRV